VINGTEKQLDYPKIWCQINWRIGTSHLFLLVFKIGSAIHHGSYMRILIKLAKELLGHLVVSDLCKFESDTTSAVLRVARLKRIVNISDSIKNRILGLSSGLAIGNSNDKDRLLQLALGSLREYYLINDLPSQRRAHWRQALELDTSHNLLDLIFI